MQRVSVFSLFLVKMLGAELRNAISDNVNGYVFTNT